eukprot:6798704-Prymnesium_polylepis.1
MSSLAPPLDAMFTRPVRGCGLRCGYGVLVNALRRCRRAMDGGVVRSTSINRAWEKPASKLTVTFLSKI